MIDFLFLAKAPRAAKEDKNPDHRIGGFVFGLELGGYGEFLNAQFVLARLDGKFSA